MNRPILFIGASRIFQAIPIRNHPSAKVTILYHLLLSQANAYGGFLAFTGRLPIANVIHKFVNVRIEALLSFIHTPHSNSVLYKPFHDKRRFILSSAQPVEHKNKKNIETLKQRLIL